METSVEEAIDLAPVDVSECVEESDELMYVTDEPVARPLSSSVLQIPDKKKYKFCCCT
jgi:hypothetical protein